MEAFYFPAASPAATLTALPLSALSQSSVVLSGDLRAERVGCDAQRNQGPALPVTL